MEKLSSEELQNVLDSFSRFKYLEDNVEEVKEQIESFAMSLISSHMDTSNYEELYGEIIENLTPEERLANVDLDDKSQIKKITLAILEKNYKDSYSKYKRKVKTEIEALFREK